jgi:hypothetical protein
MLQALRFPAGNGERRRRGFVRGMPLRSIGHWPIRDAAPQQSGAWRPSAINLPKFWVR